MDVLIPTRTGSTERLASARNAPFPDRISPMLATLVEAAFDSRDHLFEVKWDGVRVIAFIRDGKVTLRSRSHRDMTGLFPELQSLADQVRADNAVLDGEIVSFTRDGKPSFNQLQHRLGVPGAVPVKGRAAGINYQVFDILYCADHDLLDVPLIDRKAVLAEFFASGDYAQATDFVVIDGIDYFEAIRNLGLEGMIAKHMQSRYQPGKRSNAWQKVKVSRSGSFVVGGYTFGGGYRTPFFGALLLGLYDGAGDLRFVGQVGGGFTDALLKQIRPLLDERATSVSPFADPPRIERFSFWCTPTLVCKVRYAELTAQGRLRFPIFDSLRPGADPRECTFDALETDHIVDL